MLLRSIIWRFAILLLLAAGLPGCSSDNNEPEAVWDGDLCLLLRVGVAGQKDGLTPAISRAEGDDEDVSYQLPLYDTEKLRTLRVIIVEKKNDSIVHNHFETLIQPSISYEDLKFKVKFSTDYYIYLIGNEASFPGIDAKEVFEDNLKVGDTYPNRALEDIIIEGTAGLPVIDNTGTVKTAIPMSEKFELHTVDAPKGTDIQYIPTMEKTFFITRAFSKFTFNLYRSADYVGDNTLNIRKIKISGMGSREFLLPNDTEYIPGKYEDSTNEYGGRFISNFSVPAGAPTGEWEYSTPRSTNTAELPVWGGKYPGQQYAPQLYFTESIGRPNTLDKFQCSISFDGEEYLPPLTFPNLPSLPRNTHVIVNIIVGNDNALLFKVAVLPWGVRYHEVDFTDHVGIAEDGALALDADTYASFDKQTGRVVLPDYPAGTTGSFGISSPIGARWFAYLITTEGEMNQIQFETTDEEGKTVTVPYLSGLIDGKKTHFKVVSTSSAGSQPRAAILQVIVTMLDGLSVPVDILKGVEYGEDLEHITFIQNPQ